MKKKRVEVYVKVDGVLYKGIKSGKGCTVCPGWDNNELCVILTPHCKPFSNFKARRK